MRNLYLCVLLMILQMSCVSGVFAYTANVGDGADGAVTISTAKIINTQTIATGRTYADGIAYRVTAPADGATAVTRYTGTLNLSNGLVAGDEVLLINLQGTSADNADVGNYEFMQIQSVAADTITFTTAITKSFDGTSAANQKVIIQRIPNYTTVTLSGSGSLTAQAWDGLTATPSGAAGYYTGIVAFRANGTITVGSGTSITVAGKGYRGGTGGYATTAQQGESYSGTGAASKLANNGGGGGSADAGVAGAVTGGGGAGYGANGTWGGVNRTSPGTAYGSATLTKIYHGSGGGGGRVSPSGVRAGGDGGIGGGIIFIAGNAFTVSGTVLANGGNGNPGANLDASPDDGGPGGGGAGGTIYAVGNNVTLGMSAIGGLGATGHDNWPENNAGHGAVGRIFIQYANSFSGITNPVATTERLEEAPTVATQAATNIAPATATISGNITNTGNINPERIIEYGTISGNLTSSCTQGTGGEGVYSCNLTGLSPSTTYYFRAKAVNTKGTAYGNEMSFTTTAAMPTVVTHPVTVITSQSAVGNGEITYVGIENPERMIEWGTTSGNYTNFCSAGTGGTGTYSCTMSLLPSTTYYARAKAKNTAGTSYGSETSFTTQPSPLQPRGFILRGTAGFKGDVKIK